MTNVFGIARNPKICEKPDPSLEISTATRPDFMPKSARVGARSARIGATMLALAIACCTPASADELIDASEYGTAPGGYGRAGHSAWLSENLREIFTPAPIEEAPLEPSPAYPPPAVTTPAPVDMPSPRPAEWSEPLPPTSTFSGPIFAPTSLNLFDGLTLFGGLDGSKQPQDLGVNANMGGRLSFNWGREIVDHWGLGVQGGGAYDFSDNTVQVLHRLGGSDRRDQFFGTLGLFQRTDWGFNWNFAYDSLWQSYYDDFRLSQWRGRAGYQISDTDEIGVWGTKADSGDSGNVLGIPVHLRPISMANFFWRHTWSSAAWTTFWIGRANEHGVFVLGLPNQPPIKNAFIYGADLQMPLNNWFAIYGEANFITPASSGTVDAYLGFVFYPGGGVRQALQKRYAPLMPTASNVSFAVDMNR
jgi:hypothetical protein